jgi:hypothetical protein
MPKRGVQWDCTTVKGLGLHYYFCQYSESSVVLNIYRSFNARLSWPLSRAPGCLRSSRHGAFVCYPQSINL